VFTCGPAGQDVLLGSIRAKNRPGVIMIADPALSSDKQGVIAYRRNFEGRGFISRAGAGLENWSRARQTDKQCDRITRRQTGGSRYRNYWIDRRQGSLTQQTNAT